MRFVIAVKRVR